MVLASYYVVLYSVYNQEKRLFLNYLGFYFVLCVYPGKYTSFLTVRQQHCTVLCVFCCGIIHI